jgi:hypothetical protein
MSIFKSIEANYTKVYMKKRFLIESASSTHTYNFKKEKKQILHKIRLMNVCLKILSNYFSPPYEWAALEINN